MALVISEQIIQATGRTESELRMDLAVIFYSDFKMSPGKCAAFLGISRLEFLEVLGKRKIPRNYDVTDLEEDLKTLENLNI